MSARRITYPACCTLLVATVFIGCTDTTTGLHPSEAPQVQLSHVPGQPVCHNVHGHLHEEGAPNDFEGEMSGDLVGTTAGGLTDFFQAGKSGHNFGTRTYFITGGSVPALIGSQFTVDFVGIALGDGPIFPVNERAKATGGVRQAHLTARGPLDASGLPFFFELDFEYRGVVCP